MFTYLNTKKLITDNVLYLGECVLSLLGTSVPIEILDLLNNIMIYKEESVECANNFKLNHKMQF